MRPRGKFVIGVAVLHFTLAAAYPQSGLELGGGRARQYISCRSDQEYLSGSFCCLKCPAGTYVKSHCTKSGERGQCNECDSGTYTEHENGLGKCFKCTQCRSDQEIARPCTRTQNSECRCKPGRFCDPDDACEVCKKCSRCKNDEELVRTCTSTTNTECKKIPLKPDTDKETAAIVVPCFFLIFFIVLAVITILYKKKWRAGIRRNITDGIKEESYPGIRNAGESGEEETRRPSGTTLPRQLVRPKSSSVAEDERKMLCESLSSSASNSQHSLTGLHTSAPRASPVVPDEPRVREDKPLPELVPVNGEESLMRCFEFFEELDWNHHKRFFRHLGIGDNDIKSQEHLLYEDRIHNLLKIWLEKEGKGASLNDLLRTLISLKLRLTAEEIHKKAVDNGLHVLKA